MRASRLAIKRDKGCQLASRVYNFIWSFVFRLPHRLPIDDIESVSSSVRDLNVVRPADDRWRKTDISALRVALPSQPFSSRDDAAITLHECRFKSSAFLCRFTGVLHIRPKSRMAFVAVDREFIVPID